MTRVLTVEGLTTSFPDGKDRLRVVDGVDLHLDTGETLALVGESGCGKSMTALSIMRLVPRPGRADARVARFESADGTKELLDLPVPAMRRVRGAGISMIFQEPMTSLNPVARVGRQVVEAIRLHEKVSAAGARDRTLELFRLAGIPDPAARFEAYPHQLSGGLKQRVMIAMALCTRPQVLIADEPTTALDVTIQAQILELLRDLQRELGTAILLITHDLGVVNELADRVAVMYGGRIVEQGGREDVLARPTHPYTEGLLRSMPARSQPGEPLPEIAGVVPPPHTWPPGCRFASRCPRVLDPCAGAPPDWVTVRPGHTVACLAVAQDRVAS